MVLSYVEVCGMEPVMYLRECTNTVVVFCMTAVLLLYLDIVLYMQVYLMKATCLVECLMCS